MVKKKTRACVLFTSSCNVSTQAENDWITISYFLLEAIASAVMTVIVVLLLLLRRSELHQVRKK